MDRAYAVLSIKSVDAEQRVIEGIASTPELDRQGDVMDSAGAKFALPIPLLWQHQKDKPIGQVIDARVTNAGIQIKAQIASGVLPFIDEAWQLIKSGLIRGLSIGWRPLAAPTMKNGAAHFSSWEWLELSAVTIPANQSATIRLVKSLDQSALAASGMGRSVSVTPGVSGSSRTASMNISEQVTAEKAVLQTKSARLEALMNADQTNGGLDADETTERDGLVKDINGLTAKISQLETLETAQMRLAGNIQPAVSTGVKAKTVDVVNLPKGTLFTRYFRAIAAGHGSLSDTLAFAKQFDGQTPEVSRYIKQFGIKAVEGTTDGSSPAWGAELINPLQLEFIELLMPATIIGRINGFAPAVFDTPLITQTGGSTFEWVGEGGSKPVGQLAFDRTTMAKAKVAGIIVQSDELIQDSRPSSEALVRQDLIKQAAKFLDEQFIRVAVSAGPHNPASITNGVSSPAASGPDVGSLLSDLNDALATFDNANIGSDGLVIVMTPALARGISTLLFSNGGLAFPSMNPSGGTLLGYPVIVSASVDAGTLVIFKPSEIFLAGDNAVRLDASNQATLDMGLAGSPSAPTFNLWQRNCTAIRAEQRIRWQKRRPDVVAVIDTASYGPVTGSP